MADYQGENPFDSDEESKDENRGNNPFEQPPPLPRKESIQPPLPPKSEPAPYVPPKASSVDPALLAKAEELKKREAEIARREANLDGREEILEERVKEFGPPRIPNWPMCKPLIYHNIAGDSPTPETKRMLQSAYIAWMYSIGCLIYNFICMLSVLIATGQGQAIGDMVVSIVYILFLGPIWFLIYRLLYRAVRKTKPSFYILFWIFYFLEVANAIFFCVGFPGAAAGGIFYMTKMFSDDQVAVGFMLLACAILWGIFAAFSIWIFISSRIEYKKAGGLARAKREAASAAVDFAKSNPDLIKEGATFVGKEAMKHPDLVVQGARAAANSQSRT